MSGSDEVPKPEINLYKLMEEIRTGRGKLWIQKSEFFGNCVVPSKLLDKMFIKEVCFLKSHTPFPPLQLSESQIYKDSSGHESVW